MVVKAKQSERVTRVWGDSKKGIAIIRSARKKGKYSYDIHHVKNGKTVIMHRDFGKTEAIKEAKSYAQARG